MTEKQTIMMTAVIAGVVSYASKHLLDYAFSETAEDGTVEDNEPE